MSHATAGEPHTHLSIFSVPPGKQVPGLWGTNDLFKLTTCRQNMMQESHCLSKTYKNSKEIKTGKNAPNDMSRGSLSNVQDSATLLSLARFRTTKALWHCSKVSALSRAFVPKNSRCLHCGSPASTLLTGREEAAGQGKTVGLETQTRR